MSSSREIVLIKEILFADYSSVPDALKTRVLHERTAIQWVGGLRGTQEPRSVRAGGITWKEDVLDVYLVKWKRNQYQMLNVNVFIAFQE